MRIEKEVMFSPGDRVFICGTAHKANIGDDAVIIKLEAEAESKPWGTGQRYWRIQLSNGIIDIVRESSIYFR